MIFAGYTGSKNPVRNRLKIKFVELDFSKLIFQKSSTDQIGLQKFKALVKESALVHDISTLNQDPIQAFIFKAVNQLLVHYGKWTRSWSTTF